MSPPRVIVLRTAGTNCDQETIHAWQLAGARPQPVHVRALIEQPRLLDEFGILTIPGGFSYGDDISAGKILATQLIHHLADALARFVEAGKLVLGICNGFQVLVKAGLLPGPLDGAAAVWARHPAGPIDPQSSTLGLRPEGDADPASQTVTLTQNDSARFEDRWIRLKSTPTANAFVPPNTIIELPIAHGEGKLVARDDSVRRLLVERKRIALTYCDADGRPGPYPINPNGSECDIAGLTDATGRVLGLMPHPERHVHATQHPLWTRRPNAQADGRLFFDSAVRHARD
ncbi:MAG: phosphoribosylformylglycinamidine synthase I [Planctomycetes bacterium]|nr:phosphoribosylformylglycinamidine synthase I [Planctomycetota bacterium]